MSRNRKIKLAPDKAQIHTGTSTFYCKPDKILVHLFSRYITIVRISFSELSPHSAEILFEVYDRNPAGVDAPAKFLGLGLVGVDELSVGPASSQILALQPRPYETDDVQGAITVEFVFIEGAEVPAGRRPYKMKEALKINNATQPNGKFITLNSQLIYLNNFD